MKQRYKTYRGSLEANSKERALNDLPADYPARPWPMAKLLEIKSVIARSSGPIVGEDDLASLSACIDLCWLRDGCPTIFIDSTAVLDMLIACNIDILYEEIYLPIFEGESPGNPISMFREGKNPFSVSEGSISFAIPSGGCVRPFCVGRVPNAYGGWAYMISIRLGWASVMHSFCTDNTDFQKHLNGGSFQKDVDINPEESAEITNCWRLFAATLLYMAAFPHLIKNGPPSDTTPLERRSILKGSDRISTISLPPEVRNAPSPHLRRFHFRTLRAERYRRNVDGSPRVIAVRQAVIGDISRSKTAKEPEGFTVKGLKG